MAKVILNRVFILLVLLSFLSGLSTTSAFSAPLKKDQIDQFIEQERAKAKVPGLSVAVIHNGETYIQGYGTADINEETLVNKNTLFELGSNSKAFTGLALLHLADEHKVQLTYPVSWGFIRDDPEYSKPVAGRYSFRMQLFPCHRTFKT